MNWYLLLPALRLGIVHSLQILSWCSFLFVCLGTHPWYSIRNWCFYNYGELAWYLSTYSILQERTQRSHAISSSMLFYIMLYCENYLTNNYEYWLGLLHIRNKYHLSFYPSCIYYRDNSSFEIFSIDALKTLSLFWCGILLSFPHFRHFITSISIWKSRYSLRWNSLCITSGLLQKKQLGALSIFDL